MFYAGSKGPDGARPFTSNSGPLLTGLMKPKPCTESMPSPARMTLIRMRCRPGHHPVHPFVW